jgi:hypothetical protein
LFFFFLSLFFSFFVALGFEFRASTLSHSTSPVFVLGFGFFQDGGLANYLPRLALNHDPPEFCLLSSLDYRCEPPMPGFAIYFCFVLTNQYSTDIFPSVENRFACP